MVTRTRRVLLLVPVAAVVLAAPVAWSSGWVGESKPGPQAQAQALGPAGPPPKVATASPTVAVSRAPVAPMTQNRPILPSVVVSVGTVKQVTVKSESPGQVAGKAVAATVTVKNGSAQPFALGGMTVTASYQDGVPGDSTTASPSKELKGSLAAGASATGVYVFMVPAGADPKALRLEVTSDQAPTILRFGR